MAKILKNMYIFIEKKSNHCDPGLFTIKLPSVAVTSD